MQSLAKQKQHVQELITLMNKIQPSPLLVIKIVNELYSEANRQQKNDLTYEFINSLRVECLADLLQTERFEKLLFAIETQDLHLKIMKTLKFSLQRESKESEQLLWSLLNSWAQKGTIWFEIETVFKYLKIYSSQFKKFRQQFQAHFYQFLTQLLTLKFSTFCKRIIKDKIDISWFVAPFEEALITSLKQLIRTEQTAESIYTNYLQKIHLKF